MLNKEGQRELAYLVKVEDITTMNADRLECAHIGGWHCVVGKGEFKVGDPAVYFEIDSQLPDAEPFSSMEFLKSKKFKIKSQRIRGEVSQGLLMPISAWNWNIAEDNNKIIVIDNDDNSHNLDDESRFLTNKLNITYSVQEDNNRKKSFDKYKAMSQRHKKLFNNSIIKKIMKYKLGRKIMFFFFGKKKDKANNFPYWVKKTDEERIQNMSWILKDINKEWIATEKIDGSSTTFTVKGFGRKRQFVVCSRNVAFNKEKNKTKCYYPTNIYTEMAEKYNMEEIMGNILDYYKENKDSNIDFITIQAETYGEGVQKRDYEMKRHDMAIFNIIFGYKDGNTIRLNPIEGEKFAQEYYLPYVPVLGVMKLPNNCDEVIKIAESGKSRIDDGMREGIVFRSFDGEQSFKAVSNEFLLKYHG